LFLHQGVRLKGVKNIETTDRLEIGINYVGFIHKTDKTLLNIKGKLKLNGNYSIGRGCRFDIGKNAVVSIGKGGYTNCNTTFIIMHRLTIGDNCAISWDCQFLDEDFHKIIYDGKKESNNSIVIGNNVWIGCGVKIYKSTIIPNGCVIASNSVVKGKFSLENTIIGGNPAKVIKKGVIWN
jgi:acetyltransferase-like isoleucine patch superfamily enzyme